MGITGNGFCYLCETKNIRRQNEFNPISGFMKKAICERCSGQVWQMNSRRFKDPMSHIDDDTFTELCNQFLVTIYLEKLNNKLKREIARTLS